MLRYRRFNECQIQKRQQKDYRLTPLALWSRAALLLWLCMGAVFPTPSARAEWDQWRGSSRNGISDDTTPIKASFPEAGLKEIWKSDTIPSDHDGGHSSLVVSEGRLFLNVVWHTDVPSEQRLIDGEVMSQLGYRGTKMLGPELTAKMEELRKNRNPRLRGTALDEWAREWVKQNFSEEQRLILGSWAESRFKQGRQAIDLVLLDQINQRNGKPFSNPRELQDWLTSELKLPEDIRERVIKAVPNTIKTAQDVVLCLSAKTGETLWKFAIDGAATGRNSASTCAVADGRVFAAGSTHLYALKADTGELIWKTPVKANGKGSSPLVADDKVWLMEGSLICLNAADGKMLWSKKEVNGTTSSPILWTTTDGKTTLVCQTNKNVSGLDPETGDLRWTLEGGGQSTPVTQDDHLVILSGTKGVGLRCYLAQPDATKPKTLWTHWFLAARYSSSPLIYEDSVYLLGSSRHLCAALTDGKIRWDEQVESTISSPVLMDGKMIIMDNNGSFLRLIKATPESYQVLGRTKVGAMWCPTPTPWQGRLIVRRKDHVVCFDLRDAVP